MEQPCKVYKNPPLIVVSLDGVTSSKSDDSGKGKYTIIYFLKT